MGLYLEEVGGLKGALRLGFFWPQPLPQVFMGTSSCRAASSCGCLVCPRRLWCAILVDAPAFSVFSAPWRLRCTAFVATYSFDVNLLGSPLLWMPLCRRFLWLHPKVARYYRMMPQLPMVWGLCIASCVARGLLWVVDLAALMLGFIP
jgi:hypothetical protein